MSENPDGAPPPLSSPEYRRRLLRKLNCLIAVLAVATHKVERSLEVEGCDEARLLRIRTNLHETRAICLRARKALEQRAELPPELRERLAFVANEPVLEELAPAEAPGSGMPPGARAEMGSEEEHERFRGLGPIPPAMIAECDLEELTRRLQG
jgi:hypothetical protein